MTDLEHELADKMSRQLAEEIDWELLCEILKTLGWTTVSITESWSKIPASYAHEIKEWCKENLKGLYKGRGSHWVFEKEQDAEWFILRWA